jgi:homoserine O-acetyltransferase/O-succinyltransferase
MISMKSLSKIAIPLMLLVLLAAPAVVQAQGELRLADLGDFRLESGQVIQECRLGYRTFGTLNKERSNAILFPTWFAGTSKDLVALGFIGPSKLADTSRYFVVAVDALGNGVSSSPSNSKKQPGRTFPEFTVRDMVKAQHQLLTKVLGIGRLHAVIGISMGGMQAFQWTLSYPGIAQKAVSIMGTPRAASSDLFLFDTGLRAIDTLSAIRDGEALGPEGSAALLALAALTPEFYLKNLSRSDVTRALDGAQDILLKYSLTDWAWQLKAMIGHDIYRLTSEREAAGAIRTKLLVIVSRNDFLVNPEPSLALAGSLKADTLVLQGDCGHFSVVCEPDRIVSATAAFLSRRN